MAKIKDYVDVTIKLPRLERDLASALTKKDWQRAEHILDTYYRNLLDLGVWLRDKTQITKS